MEECIFLELWQEKDIVGKYLELWQRQQNSLTKPVKDLTKKELDIIFYGYDEKFKFDYTGGEFDFHGYKEYEGAVKNLERRYYESFSEAQKEEIENRYMVERICKVVREKIEDEVLAVTVMIKYHGNL